MTTTEPLPYQQPCQNFWSLQLHWLVYTTADCDKHQFGFKSHHSTGRCTHMFKQTVDYYTSRESHVFTCFVDFSQAFDSVNYWKLFNKLLDDKIDVRIVSILMHWYIKQEACVH